MMSDDVMTTPRDENEPATVSSENKKHVRCQSLPIAKSQVPRLDLRRIGIDQRSTPFVSPKIVSPGSSTTSEDRSGRKGRSSENANTSNPENYSSSTPMRRTRSEDNFRPGDNLTGESPLEVKVCSAFRRFEHENGTNNNISAITAANSNSKTSCALIRIISVDTDAWPRGRHCVKKSSNLWADTVAPEKLQDVHQQLSPLVTTTNSQLCDVSCASQLANVVHHLPNYGSEMITTSSSENQTETVYGPVPKYPEWNPEVLCGHPSAACVGPLSGWPTTDVPLSDLQLIIGLQKKDSSNSLCESLMHGPEPYWGFPPLLPEEEEKLPEDDCFSENNSCMDIETESGKLVEIAEKKKPLFGGGWKDFKTGWISYPDKKTGWIDTTEKKPEDEPKAEDAPKKPLFGGGWKDFETGWISYPDKKTGWIDTTEKKPEDEPKAEDAPKKPLFGGGWKDFESGWISYPDKKTGWVAVHQNNVILAGPENCTPSNEVFLLFVFFL